MPRQIDTSLRTPARRWDPDERAFAPVPAAPDTTVAITTESNTEIDLVLTFEPLAVSPTGVPRVAALQTVTSKTSIDFTTQAPLYWVVSALKKGELGPNQAERVFSDNADRFFLRLSTDLVVSHGPDGWDLPVYDPAAWTLHVGFGLKIRGWVYWGYSVLCRPGGRVAMAAGAYVLVRSDGAERIGDPVAMTGLDDWSMTMGHDYTLDFDETGQGVLHTRDTGTP